MGAKERLMRTNPANAIYDDKDGKETVNGVCHQEGDLDLTAYDMF